MTEREHALLSASSAHRWLNCPPSAVAAEKYEDTGSEFAAEGTLAHEAAELVARERLAGRKPDLVNYEGWAEGTDREMVEHAHAYADYIQERIKDDNAVVLLEQRVDFSTWVPDGFGTCDCIIIQGDTLTIIDYKYGVGVPVSAVDNPQMRLYALGALSDFGFAYDVEKVETHIFQPRINNISDDQLTAAELLAWGEKVVKPIAEKAAKGKGRYMAGEHCKFCPHAGRCRTLTKTCTEYVETHSLRVAVPVLAPHEVAEVLAMEPLVALWLKRVKAQALNTMLDGGEIPGYKVVAGRQGNRKWSDELQVAEVLKGAGYSQEDYTETKLLGPAAIDKLVGKKKATELLGGLIRRDEGQPTIAVETDKRPAYDRVTEAQEDFKE